ncbi:MAG: hypothetical protein ACP5OG_01125 [Candidatus Nanoarchaeia archaeon]
MAKVELKDRLGALAFLIGVVVAVIIGLFTTYLNMAALTFATWLLVLLGLVVGLLNVNDKEASKFLFAGTVLVVVSFMSANSLSIIPAAARVFNAIMVLFVPATIIVALKSVFSVSKN